MSTATASTPNAAIPNPALAREIDALRQMAGLIGFATRVNLEGVTHADSLVQPQPAGNCLNWVLGHMLSAHNNAVQLVGGQPVVSNDSLKQYSRGADPVRDASTARDFNELKSLWEEAVRRLEAGFGNLTEERLAEPAPFSPGKNPNETVRSLFGVMMFHQTYHAGQLGVLRRLIGKEGAIR